MKALKEALLKAPDSQLDACMFPLIEKWDDNPTALQILEVLDECIYSALASGHSPDAAVLGSRSRPRSRSPARSVYSDHRQEGHYDY